MGYKVAIIMGSDSDFKVMAEAIPVLEKNNIAYDIRITSAHRTPDEMALFAKKAKENGYDVIIAGAGGAAHLPGMTASITGVPVLGVPIRTRGLDGIDSVLSILQMPAGIPVATMGINNAKGAAELAVKMLSRADSKTVQIRYDERKITKEDMDVVVNTLAIYGLHAEFITDVKGLGAQEAQIGQDTQVVEEKQVVKEKQVLQEAQGVNMTKKADRNTNAIGVVNLGDRTLVELEALAKEAPHLPLLTMPVKGNVFADFAGAQESMRSIWLASNNTLPIAMLAVNGFQNAGIMMAKIAGIHEPEIYRRVIEEQEQLRKQVKEKDARFARREYPQ